MKRITVTDNHRRDFEAYRRWRREHSFAPRRYLAAFDGAVTAEEAFVLFESQGKSVNCSDPLALIEALEGKAALNAQIKDWAEGWFDCGGRTWFEELQATMSWLPDWVWRAVENQRWNRA